jgi:hypothetical protein
VRRVTLLFGLSMLAAVPGAAARDGRISRPEQAVAAVKRIVVADQRACRTDWAKIRALGYEGHWKVTVTVRSSRAGRGDALWTIGGGHPEAADAFARRLAHGCPPQLRWAPAPTPTR